MCHHFSAHVPSLIRAKSEIHLMNTKRLSILFFAAIFCYLAVPNAYAQQAGREKEDAEIADAMPYEDLIPEPPAVVLPPREAALDALFSIPPDIEQLNAAVVEAQKLGIHEQAITEAKFLFHVEHKNEQGIIDLLPTWQQLEKTFSLDHSEIFATREDFLAVLEFSRALQSLKSNDRAGFKKHITEALWLSPAQASAFTPYIAKMRLDEHVEKAQIDLNSKLAEINDGEAAVLKTILGEKPALLLHFWSPWSPDCETSLTSLGELSPFLKEKNVALASILIDGRTEILAEAREFLKGQDKPIDGPQLIDRVKNSLASQMRVTDMPTLILLSPDGKILFHGRPEDPLLRDKINASSAKKP
jgi:thiol-disulfide isomerase/thioredoxin